jgi:hypothetical protein
MAGKDRGEHLRKISENAAYACPHQFFHGFPVVYCSNVHPEALPL